MAQTTAVLSSLRSLGLESRLRGYRYPSASEENQLSGLVTEANQEMGRLDTEILKLQHTLYTLQNEKKELEGHVLHCKSLLAPIRKLPPEVLTQIFLHHGTVNQLTSPVIIPTLELSNVCWHWNSVLRQPMFWSQISVDLNDEYDASAQSDMLRNILSRSADRPLSVHLSRPRDSPDENGAEDTDTAVDVLIEQSHRWTSLQLTLPPHTINRVLRRLGEILRLKTLEIVPLPDGQGFTDSQMIVPIFENAPQLHAVKLDRLSPINVNLPWNQITHLQYTMVDPATLTQALRVCNKVQSVSVDEVIDDSVLSEPREHVVSSMKSLILRFGPTFQGVKETCDLLTAPNLEALCFSSHKLSCWAEGDATSIVKLITRSSCTLTSLSFQNIHFEEVDLIEILHRIPTITSLSIHEPVSAEKKTPLSYTLFNRMDPYAFDQSPLLPRLADLDISIRSEKRPMRNPQASRRLPQQALVEMIQVRWQPDRPEGRVAHIRNVQLVLPDCPKQVIDTVRCLKQAGLAISLVSVDTLVGLKTFV